MNKERLLQHTPVESIPEFLKLREEHEDEDAEKPAS